MTSRQTSHLLCCICLTLATAFPAAAQWTQPTPEELSMTSQPQVPGAPAVYLYREETTEDHLHMFSVYVRLKVLTEGGKEYGTVELPYYRGANGSGKTVEDVEGRTIHPDGTIIPFKGKPLEKMVQKTADYKIMTKVFSLPDVQVGSIVEYRYKLRMDDHYFDAPQWYIQSKLFTRKAYYRWRPTGETLIDNSDGGKLTSAIAWAPVLPPGVTLKQTQLPSSSFNDGQRTFEVTLNDIPPIPDEEYMPPTRSFTYRVLFYYTPYRTPDEFWKNKGKTWSKRSDKFIGPGPGVTAEAQRLAAPTDTQEQKLRKFYAAVMQFENTDFTRERNREEEKSAGLQDTRTTDDILARKRGSSDQLAALFVALARGGGMKSYLAVVTNRDQNLFTSSYLNMSQLDDDLAIVVVDGKERFFDPGSRYCSFGHLAWKHTFASGLRQLDGGNTVLFSSPSESYKEARLERVANLKMDEQGKVSGQVKLSFVGAPALRWRQDRLRGDDESLRRDLRVAAEHLLPAGMDVKVQTVNGIDSYEQPLVVTYEVEGPIGSSTGKRLVVPAALFEANTPPAFPHEKRESAVYFPFPSHTIDAIRINLPASLAVESLPTKQIEKFSSSAVYNLNLESTPTSVTIRREFANADILYPPKEYGDLRTFYSKLQNDDQEAIVLTHAAPKSPASGN